MPRPEQRGRGREWQLTLHQASRVIVQGHASLVPPWAPQCLRGPTQRVSNRDAMAMGNGFANFQLPACGRTWGWWWKTRRPCASEGGRCRAFTPEIRDDGLSGAPDRLLTVDEDQCAGDE